MSTTRGIRGRPASVAPPVTPRELSGLCSTCIHAGECVNAARGKMPVVHCEEFDDRVISPLKPAESQFTLAARTKENSHQASDNDPQLKGLCVNCDNRKICKHPKPESGVWYCEEYR
jgi:hypothetical protein